MSGGHENAAFKADENGVERRRKKPPEVPGTRRKPPEAVPKGDNENAEGWDVFKTVFSDSEGDEGSRFYEYVCKALKIITYIGLFLFVLFGTIISKGTLLTIAANMKRQTPVRCFELSGSGNATKCQLFSAETSSTNVSMCGSTEEKGRVLRMYEAPICDAITVRWIWAAMLVVCVPNIFVSLRALWKISFKSVKNPTVGACVMVTLSETIHSVGMSVLVFRVLPSLPSIHGLIVMLGVSLTPGILKIVFRSGNIYYGKLQVVVDIIASLVQVSALIYWPVMMRTQNVGRDDIWPVPLALLFISVHWWETYIRKSAYEVGLNKPPDPLEFSHRTGFSKFKFWLKYTRYIIKLSRAKINIFVGFWKCGVTLVMAMVLQIRSERSMGSIFNFSIDERCNNKVTFKEIPSLKLDWLWLAIINISVGLVVYSCARTAAKIQMQRVSYAIPLLLATPLTLAFLIGGCEIWNNNNCAFYPRIPGHIFFNCYAKSQLGNLFTSHHIWILGFWWLSQVWITRNIWFSFAKRLTPTEKLFSLSLWDGVVLEQHMLHNRSIDLAPKREDNTDKGQAFYGQMPKKGTNNRSSIEETVHPFIYLCATMWHETEEEMVQILKSIFRLDQDQADRRNVKEHLSDWVKKDPDYYEFEAHIFFDDAFQPHLPGEESGYNVNDFVKCLVKSIGVAANAVHGVADLQLKPPVKYDTPYGGRLEWTMPGDNKIIAHLKDKMKIRHKKRWSQVMYMYYMLGHRLYAKVKDDDKKQTLAENTFLLALDGDVDFQPVALQLLVDLMKKDPQVGAACGRIHPIGTGPMVWYQKFEYALGHWMQKATEHVLGCVLCSPGCFSLFRGSALMDDNVMHTYTRLSTEAKHYVQYDQGEDRWLCTLLLQQGYRVEYCAASDALTFAPEGFSEFYNQRRRWTPSTMANILDLLMSWRKTVSVNDNISMLYIFYQMALFVASIIGPGSIFLMIVGALNSAFGRFGLTMWGAFLVNLIPVLIFVILCFVTKSNTQLIAAQILTTIYSVIQMLVLVGICIQMRAEGPCSPVFIFFMFVAGTFVLAAILHPQEFFCLIHGVIYFLVIPSMYMLLIIYALTNLNVVSWGTREVPVTQAEKEIKKKQEKKSGPTGKFDFKVEDRGFKVKVGDWFRCLCCPRQDTAKEDTKFIKIMEEFDQLKVDVHRSRKDKPVEMRDAVTQTRKEAERQRAQLTHAVVIRAPEDEIMWINDPDLQDGDIELLEGEEAVFFEGLIDKYLKPLDKNKDQEDKAAQDLKDLRNKASFAFLLLNAIFVTVVFTLQIQKEESGLSIPWPCGQNLSLEPVGFVFLIVFGAVITIQVLGMLIHRSGTFLHIMALTKLHRKKKRADKLTHEEGLALARRLGRVKEGEVEEQDEVYEDVEAVKKLKRKSVIKKRESVVPVDKTIRNQFTKRLKEIQDAPRNISNEELSRTVFGVIASRKLATKRTQTIKNCRDAPARPPRRRDNDLEMDDTYENVNKRR